MITLDNKTHTYTNTETGKRLVSVTQVLKHQGFLQMYDNRSTKPRDRGTAVHEAVALLEKGMVTPEDYIGTEVFPYLGAYQRFARQSGWTPVYIEEIVAYHDQYAGKIDQAGWINDELIILDLKTGSSPAMWHGIQGAAYRQAWNDTYPDRVGRFCVLYLKKKGTYTLASGYRSRPYTDKFWDAIWREALMQYHAAEDDRAAEDDQ